MSSEASDLCPESESFLEEVIVYFQNRVSREMLHFLLTDREAWERFVAEASLSGEEAEALREGLEELQSVMDLEAGDPQAKERFLNEFPQWKVELKKRIRKLYELADEVDRVHKNCTVSNVATGSTGAASGVLSILGLVLAPFTGGASLALSAVGVGLGAATAVAQVSTSIVEGSSESSAIDEANRLLSSDSDKEELIGKILCPSIDLTPDLITQLGNELKDLASNVRAIRDRVTDPQPVERVTDPQPVDRVTYPQPIDNSKRLTRGLGRSVRNARLLQKAFNRSALALTKGARIMGAATAGLTLGLDVYYLVKDSEHLQEGAKTESAKEIRRQARELESKLEELTKIYEILKDDPTP